MSSQEEPKRRGRKRRVVENPQESTTAKSLVNVEPKKRGRKRRGEDNPTGSTTESFVVDKSGQKIPTGVRFDVTKLFSVGQKVINTVPKNAAPKENCQNAANELSKDSICSRTTPISFNKSFKKNACHASSTSGQQPPHPYSTYSRQYVAGISKLSANESASQVSPATITSGQCVAAISKSAVNEAAPQFSPAIITSEQYVAEISKSAANESAPQVSPATTSSGQYVAEILKPAANESAPQVSPATTSSGQNVAKISHPALIEVVPGGAGLIAQKTGLVQQIPSISSNLNTFVPLSQVLYVTANSNDQEGSSLNLPILSVQNQQLNSTEAHSSVLSSEVHLNTDQLQQEQEIFFEMPHLPTYTADNNDDSLINNVERQSPSSAQDNLSDENSYTESPTASNSEQSDIEDELDDLEQINNERRENIGERNEGNNPVPQNNNNHNLNELLEREREAHGDNCCNPCRILLLQLIRKVDNVLLHFENYNVNMNQRRVDIQVPLYDKLDMLPIDNIELLKEFDQNLGRRDAVNRELETQFRNKISNCGESDMKKAVVMILPKVLTNQLGTKLVWMIKSEGKVPIQNFNFPTIIASILSAKYNCTEDDVKKRIKLWLQKSGDRIRADQKKAERNRDEHD